MSYTPTTWSDGDPIDAPPLNKFELALQAAAAVADSAQSDATSALASASSAQTAASNAQTTANSGVSKGDAAQSTANSAVTAASTAQASANAAQSTADSALAKANKPGSVVFTANRTLASTTLAANSFVTYPLNNVDENVGGGTYDTGTFVYTVPVTGRYLCVGSIRLADSATVRNVMIGIGTTNIDGFHTAWRNMGGPSTTRDVFQYTRIAKFNAGDQVRMYIYSTTSTFATEYSGGIGNAQFMTLYLLG